MAITIVELRRWKALLSNFYFPFSKTDGPDLCWRDISHAALLYSPRSNCQFTTRCLDECFEESNVACTSTPKDQSSGSHERDGSVHPAWDGDPTERATPFSEADPHSR